MNIDLELYRIFYVVAKNKHMTRASEELHISQPAISQSIKKLEEQLGGTLFLRSNKGMELTKEGEMFYDYIKGALELIKSAENEFTSFQTLDKGEIKIGCSTTLTKIILIEIIEKFHRDYPNIDIIITNELTSNLLIDLEKGKLDLVIFNEGIISKNVSSKKLTTLRHGFIYNPKYFKDHTINLNDLQNYPLIFQKKNSNSRIELESFLKQKNISLKPKFETVSQDLVIELTNIGLGIGYTLIELTKKSENLKELNINKLLPLTNVFVATNKNLNLTSATKKFISYLNEKYL